MAPTDNKNASPEGVVVDPRIIQREEAAYKSDEEIQQYWFFQLFLWFWDWYGRLMYRFESMGWEKVPKDRPVLFVSMHTFQSSDIPLCLSQATQNSGRALQFLKKGCWMAVIPGGAEEFLHHNTKNGRHAYEVKWVSNGGKRRNGVGAVAVAMGPGFQVYPCFCENGEEMRFNVFVELWTLLRLDFAYSYLTGLLPKPLSWLFFQIGLWLSGIACVIGVPVPVKVTQHIGDAVVVEAGDTAESFSRRVEVSLQALIDSRMKGRRHRSYWEGVKARFARQRRHVGGGTWGDGAAAKQR